ARPREERLESEPVAVVAASEPRSFERVSAVEPEAASAQAPAFGRKGKPNLRGARRDPAAAPPPSVGTPAAADVPVATPTGHGPIGGSDAWLEADLARPEVHILESVGASPPGAPSDRYRVAESGPGGPTPRHEGDEEQDREHTAWGWAIDALASARGRSSFHSGPRIRP